MELDGFVADIKGVRKAAVSALGGLGVRTMRELLFHLPFRHEDFSRPLSFDAPGEGECHAVATVERVAMRRGFRGRGAMAEALLGNGTATVRAVWFNQPFVAKYLKQGATLRFMGTVQRTKFGLQLVNPTFASVSSEPGALILPVYPLAGALTQQTLRRLVHEALPLAAAAIDALPGALREKFALMPLPDALREAHFPSSLALRDAAMRRHAFDELYGLQMELAAARSRRLAAAAPHIAFDAGATKAFVASLPFALTAGQKRAAWDVMRDMEKGAPMNRLVNGDVGSGKTAVAALAMHAAARAGKQAALMAPTEVLARQHFETLRKLFAGTEIRIALWTGAYRRMCERGDSVECRGAAEKKELAAAIASGNVAIVVGTHALVEEALAFNELSLVVVDEQHRFGVEARRMLVSKRGDDLMPHLLSMTATPIPRTLALAAFGDLDVSVIAEKPKSRRPIATKVVDGSRRAAATDFVLRQIAEGRQAFVVCPLVDPSDAFGAKSVREEFFRLKDGPMVGVPMAMLHGKMKPADKERVIAAFAGGETKVLVSTSVIEVGIDVPNASVMCIEGADRFGLAQLHQFRGRVGRGTHASYCFLFCDEAPDASLARLRLLEKTNDGFALAEHDLALRGPGEMLGAEQSGFARLRVARLDDLALVRAAREAAEAAYDGAAPAAAGKKMAHFE